MPKNTQSYGKVELSRHTFRDSLGETTNVSLSVVAAALCGHEVDPQAWIFVDGSPWQLGLRVTPAEATAIVAMLQAFVAEANERPRWYHYGDRDSEGQRDARDK